MSNVLDLQDAILKAVDSLTQNRIDKLQLDKTITGNIIKCNNALTREYKVSYNGGSIIAYAKEGDTYTNGNSVYVLIPENDLTKHKLIIGLTSAQSDDNNISFVSSLLSDYNLIGKNNISDPNKIQPIGLHSYLKEEYKLLYKHGVKSPDDNPFFYINTNELNNTIKEAEAILIEASFKTRLPKEHSISTKGLYGLQFVLAYKNKDKRQKNKYKEFLPDDSLYPKPEVEKPKDVKRNKEENKEEDNSSSPTRLGIIKNDFLYIFNNRPNDAATEIEKLLFEINRRMLAAMAPDNIRIEFIDKLKNIDSINDVDPVFKELEAAKADDIRYISYNIDSDTMTGNPLRFTNWSEQYQIFPIDTENFLYIDSIMFYEKDFVKESNFEEAQDTIASWGADIFLKDVEFYGLKKISSEKDGFKLRLSLPEGNTLYRVDNQAKIFAEATVSENGSNLSDNTTFYWFKEDNRVSYTSDNFNLYGGAGWAYLKDKGPNYTCDLYGNENLAYENKYLCVAVYKEQVILKEYFTVYNEASRRDLSIHSTLGTRFSFDRGTPVLTCLVDGKEADFEKDSVDGHPDKFYRFIWSKIDSSGGTTVFSRTKEELQAEYDYLYKKMIEDEKNDKIPEEEKITFKDLNYLRNQIASLANISWDKNKLTYPVSAIDQQAKFKCSVYLRDREPAENEALENIEYCVGSAEILLQNESIATPQDYYIVIENGDQVFQYSESGVAPNDKRYAEPLEILPLSCHFFDPAGLEINKETYTLKWQVPLKDTMIITPKEGMVLNHASNLKEWYPNKIFNLEIAPNYDYQAHCNQLTAIISYQGQEYKQETNFLFTKIGENGTNGTDIVAKIEPILSMPKGHENDALVIIDGEYKQTGNEIDVEKFPPRFNDISNTIVNDVRAFTFKLYQRNEEIPTTRYSLKWSVSGVRNQSQNLNVGSNGTISWGRNLTESNRPYKYRYQILKAEAKISQEHQTYYAYYGIPVIDYFNDENRRFEITIEKNSLLKSITYNADGRNPLYNKKQGAVLHCFQNGQEIDTPYIVWTAEGGETTRENPYNPLNAAFTLGKISNPKPQDTAKQLLPADIYNEPAEDSTEKPEKIGTEYLNKVYVLPNDVYTGEYTNNIIHAALYESELAYNNGKGNPVADVYIPIYMSLNTYGLKSLNAWDGNHIEINEDENYILAPQIGAGVKNEANQFTGIVMGQAQTYDQEQKKTSTVGLLGYSNGHQSIVLNAADGSAVFGLPSQEGNINNNYAEGRVKIIPGGISEIGSWKIGNDALFNIQGLGIPDFDENGNPRNPYFTINTLTGLQQINASALPAYRDKSVGEDAYHLSVPHYKSGVILSADPSYLSIKGKQITKDHGGIDFTNANTVVQLGDSFELQLDPSDNSIFTVYRHTNAPSQIYTIKNDNIILLSEIDVEKPQIFSEVLRDTNTKQIIGWRPINKSVADNGFIVAIDGKGNAPKSDNAQPFWIFRVVKSDEDFLFEHPIAEGKYEWRREPKVGINSQGRFYTNALKDNTTALTIGNIGAFGQTAQTQQYAGASFDIGTGATNNALFKMFTDSSNINKSNGTLYFSGATAVNNEYERPLQMHFNSFELNIPNMNKTFEASAKHTNNGLKIDNENGIRLGHKTVENYFTVEDFNNFKYDNFLTIPYGEQVSSSKKEDTPISKAQIVTNHDLDILVHPKNNFMLNASGSCLSLTPEGNITLEQGKDGKYFYHNQRVYGKIEGVEEKNEQGDRKKHIYRLHMGALSEIDKESSKLPSQDANMYPCYFKQVVGDTFYIGDGWNRNCLQLPHAAENNKTKAMLHTTNPLSILAQPLPGINGNTDSSSDGGIAIKAVNMNEGIDLYACHTVNGNSAMGAGLTLLPSPTGQISSFNLYSSCGEIMSCPTSLVITGSGKGEHLEESANRSCIATNGILEVGRSIVDGNDSLNDKTYVRAHDYKFDKTFWVEGELNYDSVFEILQHLRVRIEKLERNYLNLKTAHNKLVDAHNNHTHSFNIVQNDFKFTGTAKLPRSTEVGKFTAYAKPSGGQDYEGRILLGHAATHLLSNNYSSIMIVPKDSVITTFEGAETTGKLDISGNSSGPSTKQNKI